MFNKIRIITHNGTFHTDEVFAIATLKIYLKQKYKKNFFKPSFEILRMRDNDLIQTGDFVVDVGGKYIPEKLRFDHHQFGGAGQRKNGVPYSSFGLVWKEFGKKIYRSDKVILEIDKKMVQPVDAMDNGINLLKLNEDDIAPYLFYDVISTYNFLSQKNGDKPMENFLKMVDWAEDILLREIERTVIQEKYKKEILNIYKKSKDKRLIVFDEDYDDFTVSKVLNKYPEPLFVVRPDDSEKKNWKIKTIRKNVNTFDARKDLPVEWAGKRDEELQKITGVDDAVFCHNKRFIAITKSKEGILKLAKLALEK